MVSIDQKSFKGNAGLTSVIVPEGVQYVSHYAFQGCANLVSAELPASMIYLGNQCFEDCVKPIPREPGNIRITGCRIENADRLLQYHYADNEIWQRHRPLESSSFDDIEVRGLKMPLILYGSPGRPVSLELRNARISLAREFEGGALLNAAHYRLIRLERIALEPFSLDSLIRIWTKGDILHRDVACSLPEEGYIRQGGGEFCCASI